MSGTTKVKAQKIPATDVAPACGLALHLRRAALQPSTETSTTARRSTRYGIIPLGLGHDFGQIRVQPTAASCSLGLAAPRACPFGGTYHTCLTWVQAKLVVGQPNDRYEQEADRVADLVMRTPEPCPQCRGNPEERIKTKPVAGQITPLVQREVEPENDEEEESPVQTKSLVQRQAEPEEEEEETVQTKSLFQRQVEPEEDEEEAVHTKSSTHQSATVPSASAARIESLRGGGQPLPAPVRAFFELRFGHDFSQVRVHTGAEAVESARGVNALAYTIGNHIAFEAARYDPSTIPGRRLLAHELVHTIQQRRMNRITSSTLTLSDPNNLFEREADTLSHPVLPLAPSDLARYSITQQPQTSIQRQVTRAFTEEQFEPVQKAFTENVRKTTRDSCIAIVNKGLRRLFAAQLRGRRLGSEMEKTMARLVDLHLADKPMEIQFHDARGRITRGTTEPDSLSISARTAILASVRPEIGWYLFGLSIMDGYHSVLLAVDCRSPAAPAVYWLDQIYSGFDDVTGTLDERITQLTRRWWQKVKASKGVGYNTVVRIWPITERLLGDFAVPAGSPNAALV